jgi:hypothetical protein
MKKKIFASLVTAILLLSLTVAPAYAYLLEYDTAATVTWGENGGEDVDQFIIKLQDVGVSADVAATITTISITFDQQTDLFKPQLILNSEKAGWNQADVELTTQGVYTYDLDATGKFTADSNWNELWIKSGWKNEGSVILVSIVFKDADGNSVYEVGTEDTDASAAADDTAAADDASTTAAADDAAAATDASATATDDAATATDDAATATDVPKTGVVGLGLVYGLGALVTGTALFKRKEK